jgi:hypothetical protein
LNLISLTLETGGALLLQCYSLIITNSVLNTPPPPIHLLQVDATKDEGQSARVQAAKTTEGLEATSVEVTENIVS